MPQCFFVANRACLNYTNVTNSAFSLRSFAVLAVAGQGRARAAHSKVCVSQQLHWKSATSRGHSRIRALSRRCCASTAQASAFQWSGLEAWRSSGVDNRRVWGDKGAVATNEAKSHTEQTPCSTLSAYAQQVLQTADPKQKAVLTHQAWQHFSMNLLQVGTADAPVRPARPDKPKLVPPKQVPTPKKSPLPLPVHMLHNLAHVELNAIDLAWDTVVRFSGLQLDQAFYRDFARVADDESRHLSWCLQRLEELGFAYGDMVAHSILWDGAEASSGNLAGRLAVVPMSQEARGLDAGPRLFERLVGCGDNRSAAIVGQIAAEEKAHVAVGVHWFNQLSAAAGDDPGTAYRRCITSLGQQEALRPPYNHESRQEVGLQQDWYDRSMWPSDLSELSSQTSSGTVATPAQQASGHAAKLPADALDSLRMRVATMIDTELCSSKAA